MMPDEFLSKLNKCIKPEWRTAFLSAFLIGLLVHMPVLLLDVPNHDGLSSMYFDQNMITSGRWFLTVACGFSSYYTIPWFIGILGLFFLACTSVALTELLELQGRLVIVLVSGLLMVFPALASTFAYVFTMDGYMLALFLAVVSVLLTKKYRYGFLGGAVCLAFSLGTYQAYLPFAVLLCIYCILILAVEQGSLKEKVKASLCYLYMGILGAALYYMILQILLRLQGKELDTYQGISGMSGSEGGSLWSAATLLSSMKTIYRDFLSFTIKGNILFQNVFSAAGLALLVLLTVFTAFSLFCRKKWWKNPLFFVIMALLVLGVPFCTNIILLISPNVTYHLLMRYQWVMFPILMAAFVSRYGREGRFASLRAWALCCCVAVMVFCYAVTDNIAYSNLQKRYEKTYAYCVRLLDRIEQTEGYYQGIPIAIVGVVGYVPFPETDITGDVTSGMIGISGDYLLYRGDNYQQFMKNYLGATLNFLSPEKTMDIYYSEEYISMESFPGKTSMKVIDGILCIKTENVGRD